MATLTLPFPPSANRYWRHVGKKVLLSAEARWYRECCEFGCAAQWKGGPLVGKVRIVADLFFPDLRGDLDNRVKQLLDGMQTTVLSNDSQVWDLRLIRHTDKENPRVEVTIEEIE